MGLIPTKTKYRKHQRMRVRGKASAGAVVNFGEFGLQSLECAHLTTNQIEAARKALTHYLKRGGKVWVRAFADKIITARAAETRMGGGKGAPVAYVAPVRRGHIIFEIGGTSRDDAKAALRLAAFKLPIKTRFVEKH
jgi:large subunit ribosomal protein L16